MGKRVASVTMGYCVVAGDRLEQGSLDYGEEPRSEDRMRVVVSVGGGPFSQVDSVAELGSVLSGESGLAEGEGVANPADLVLLICSLEPHLMPVLDPELYGRYHKDVPWLKSWSPTLRWPYVRFAGTRPLPTARKQREFCQVVLDLVRGERTLKCITVPNLSAFVF